MVLSTKYHSLKAIENHRERLIGDEGNWKDHGGVSICMIHSGSNLNLVHKNEERSSLINFN